MNTFATVVVYFLVALFVLHLVEGDATTWILSKFNRIATTNNPTASGASLVPPINTTPGTGPFAANPPTSLDPISMAIAGLQGLLNIGKAAPPTNLGNTQGGTVIVGPPATIYTPKSSGGGVLQ